MHNVTVCNINPQFYGYRFLQLVFRYWLIEITRIPSYDTHGMSPARLKYVVNYLCIKMPTNIVAK